MTRTTCVPLLLALLAGPFGAENWERFRGPNATGTSDDKNVPLQFGTSENVVWKAPLKGAGNSSPIVWGDRVFLHEASKDGKSRSLLCFDAASGKVLWEKGLAAV